MKVACKALSGRVSYGAVRLSSPAMGSKHSSAVQSILDDLSASRSHEIMF